MVNKVSTPCYIFDKEEFDKNISMFMGALDEYFDGNWILGYSFKTNYLPYILRSAKDHNCYAEVVSDKEYRLAKEIGFEKNTIIYNGPVKNKASFLEAIINGCIVNIDSKREIVWLKELPHNELYYVGIRVNFDLEAELPGHTLMAEEGGRFGFCDENDELTYAINEIKKIGNIEIKYLHMHVSSKTKSPEIYKHLVRRACEIAERERLDLSYIDVGGSFFGGGDDGLAYQKYVRDIRESLAACGKGDIGIIVEPGASVVASCVSYVVEIVDEKFIKHKHYLVSDGSRMHIDPFFARNKYAYSVISKNEVTEEEQSIVGFTCMEKDRILKIQGDKRLTVGDRIVFEIVGSYTMCMNSDFISSEPRVYAKCGENGYLVRKEKDISAYFINSVYEEI